MNKRDYPEEQLAAIRKLLYWTHLYLSQPTRLHPDTSQSDIDAWSDAHIAAAQAYVNLKGWFQEETKEGDER